MTEKYKIYLSEDIRTRLINDAELFEFTRKDESVNLNGFLKELIVNYFEQYRKDTEDLMNGITEEITSVRPIKPKDAAALADKIISTYIRSDAGASGKKAVITLTVSGASYNIIKIIENNLLADRSLSGYMKDMFASYLLIPRSRREEIIFRDTYEDIRKAIAGHRRLSLTSSGSGFKYIVEPYIIAPSKEEQCNYLLCRDPKTKKTRTFRISRLRNTFVTSDTFEEDEKVAERLRAIAVRSPHSAAPDIHASIRLTESGMRKYKLIVKNRPAVTKIDGDVYHFDWPETQLEDYFRRFGEDAVVIKPASLKARLRNYYKRALEAYE
ncbi:MAG: WYL domain-containing protein [Lachnospiraceae bacterium]|nr:WYL domain-containing protein [Lachnospiraceae bacterium]